MRLHGLAAAFVFYCSTALAQGQHTEPADMGSTSAPAETTVEPSPAPQTNTTTITILAKGSGIPLSKAEVKFAGQTLFADPKGNVTLTIPNDSKQFVTISRAGYLREEIPASSLASPGEYEIFLYPGTPDDDVVIVRGSRKPAISKKSVSIQEAAKVAPGGDVAQVVKLLPGVQSGNFGGEAVIRGSGPQDSKYYVDDIEVPFIFHVLNLSIIPGSMLTAVDFDSGGFGPEYGNATGGVISLRTTTDIPERAKTEWVVNIPFYSSLVHTRPLSETSSLTVSLRRSYLDLFLQEALNQQAKKEGTQTMTVSPYFADFHLIYLTKDDSGYTKYSLLSAYDGIKLVVPTDFASSSDGKAGLNMFAGFANFAVERQTRLNADWKYVTTPQFYYYSQNSDFFGNKVDITMNKFRAPTEFTKRLSKTEDLNVGFDPTMESATANLDSIRPNFDDPTADIEDAPKVKLNLKESYATLAGWANVDKDFGGLIISPGVRAQYNGQIKKTIADPRLRARYQVSERNMIKSAVGQYSSAPSPDNASKKWGNPDLDFIRSMHYILGIETKWNELWTTEFQGFYKTVDELVEQDTVKNYDNTGKLRSQGLEVFIRRNLTGRLFGWLSYTYSKTQIKEKPGDPWTNSQYDKTHIANVVGNYRLTGTWDLGGRFAYQSGGTYNKVYRGVYNADLDKYQPRTLPDDAYAGRMPDNKALTIYAKHDFLFDRSKMALRFGLESFWPQRQVQYVNYNYDYSETEEIKGLTAIPFLELQGEF